MEALHSSLSLVIHLFGLVSFVAGIANSICFVCTHWLTCNPPLALLSHPGFFKVMTPTTLHQPPNHNLMTSTPSPIHPFMQSHGSRRKTIHKTIPCTLMAGPMTTFKSALSRGPLSTVIKCMTWQNTCFWFFLICVSV